MSDDEQLQMKKDTLWEIHEQESRIACLDKKITDFTKAMADTVAAWTDKQLTVSANGALLKSQPTPVSLPTLPSPEIFTQAVVQHNEAVQELARLKSAFERM